MGTTIETITVTRPMKVIAFTCCVITTFLMVAATASSEWIKSESWREGLFEQCVRAGAPMPMPFGGLPIPGCRRAHDAGYVRGCAALCVIVCFTDFFGSVLTGLGLRSTDPNKKYKYYRVAIYCLVLCVIALLLVLIIYPVSFSKELKTSSNNMLYDGKKVPVVIGSIDFDGDGIPDYLDPDDDNDGTMDIFDLDDDNDGMPDTIDDDDDNDGVLDVDDKWPFAMEDSDGDGIADAQDTDDDNDGIIDSMDNDDDNDGVPDDQDDDDDNDGIPDALDNDVAGPDSDGDGTPDSMDQDDDNDGIPDAYDIIDTDGDGIADEDDVDDDNDGIPDAQDDDDDGDGIPDDQDSSGVRRPWSFGFGYGVSWLSFALLLLSVVMLICDRESEEIFYKEKVGDDEEEEEEEEA